MKKKKTKAVTKYPNRPGRHPLEDELRNLVKAVKELCRLKRKQLQSAGIDAGEGE